MCRLHDKTVQFTCSITYCTVRDIRSRRKEEGLVNTSRKREKRGKAHEASNEDITTEDITGLSHD
jgi:hypothetical protein